jgi:hypothetical protein
MKNMKEDQPNQGNPPNQIFSQVFLPLLLAVAVVALSAYYLFSNLVSGTIDFRMWSDISVMVIFLPLILFGLPVLMIIFAHIVLVAKIQRKVLEIGKKMRPVFIQIVKAVANFAIRSTKPLIALKSGFSFFNRQN